MDPPSYAEVIELGPAGPPPTYDVVVVLPSTPPPTYGEADAFPVLTLPVEGAVATSAAQEPATQTRENGTLPNGLGATVVNVQPQPTLAALRGDPAVISCPYCHEVVTTEIEYQPGQAVWSLCVLFTLLGLVCGCCLIPFFIRGMQDVHHTCPRCHHHLHIHAR